MIANGGPDDAPGAGHALAFGVSQARPLKVRFASDSLLEGDGFEPSVPVAREPVYIAEGELRADRRAAKKIWRGTDGSNPSPSSGESGANRNWPAGTSRGSAEAGPGAILHRGTEVRIPAPSSKRVSNEPCAAGNAPNAGQGSQQSGEPGQVDAQDKPIAFDDKGSGLRHCVVSGVVISYGRLDGPPDPRLRVFDAR